MSQPLDDLRARLRDLEAARAAGTLDAEAHERARRELDRQIADALLSEGTPGTDMATVSPAPRASRGLLASLAAAVLVLAIAGYSVTGTPGALGIGEAPPMLAQQEGAPTPEQVDALLAQLSEKMKERPDDATGWLLLARAYASRGRFAEAVPAYRRALALQGEDADLLSDLADALTALNDGNFNDEGRGMVQRALALQPDHPKSLALAGSIAFDDGDFAGAVKAWSRLESVLPADSALRPRVQESIAEARRAGGLAPGAAAATTSSAAPSSASAAPATPSSAAAAIAPLRGEVTLDPALASRVQPDDTVFVLARPADGARMPLAVLRKQVRDLPLTFQLDDSMAMAPTARLSAHRQVQVVARISRSGQAQPQAGDLVGESAAVASDAQGLQLRIDRVFTP